MFDGAFRFLFRLLAVAMLMRACFIPTAAEADGAEISIRSMN